MTTPLPDPPSTSDPASFPGKSDIWVAAQKLYQTELDALVGTLSPIGRNMLINGGFQINQRALASVTDDNFAHDRWNILTQTAAVAPSTVTDPETGYTHAMRLTQSQATAQRLGFEQIVEGVNCKHARGNSGTLSGRVRCSAATTVRYAILGWTGTEDAVTSDVVNSWTNATFTAGQFFLASNVSVLGTGSIALAANTWTQLTALTAALGTAFTNIVILVWTDSAQAQNVTLDCDYMQFEAGASATPFERRTIAQELLNCYRYFFLKSYLTVEYVAVVQAASTTQCQGKLFDLPLPMRVAPTLSTGGAGGFVGWGASLSGNIALTTFTLAANPQTVWLSNGILNSANFSGGGQAALITAGGATANILSSAEL